MTTLTYPIVDAATYADAFEKVSITLHKARRAYDNKLAIATKTPTHKNIEATTTAALKVTVATANFLKVRAVVVELRAAEGRAAAAAEG